MRPLRTAWFTLFLGIVATAPAAAQQADADLRSAADRVTPASIELRHQIHRNPELGNREFKTAALVARHLRKLGLEVRTGVAHTGVVGVLRGGKPGPVVGLRADMDALPVTEATDLPFKSTVRTTYLNRDVGVSHACGHDIHVAIQLGVASLLAGMRQELPGTVVFIFQPAEEGAPPGERGGAELMVQEGVLESPKPDAIFALHVEGDMVPNSEVGKIKYAVGPMWAASRSWDATIRGKPGHGAYPHLALDPIVVAAEAITALQTIRSRYLSPTTSNVVTVGTIRAGERHNIIPAEVSLSGTIRSFHPAVQDSIEQRIRQIFDGVTRAHGASFELQFNQAYPVTVNDPELTRRMVPTLERVAGRENVHQASPETGAEDFAFFSNRVPSFYFQLGAVRSGTVSGGHHTPTFLADDGAIPLGIRAMTALVRDFLAAGTS